MEMGCLVTVGQLKDMGSGLLTMSIYDSNISLWGNFSWCFW